MADYFGVTEEQYFGEWAELWKNERLPDAPGNPRRKGDIMNEYPVPYDLNNGKCFAPCPHNIAGVAGIVMLGSKYCRESCPWHGDYSGNIFINQIPVRCLFREKNS